jgi:hypothetical protein
VPMTDVTTHGMASPGGTDTKNPPCLRPSALTRGPTPSPIERGIVPRIAVRDDSPSPMTSEVSATNTGASCAPHMDKDRG